MPTPVTRIRGRAQPAPWEAVYRDHAAAVYAYAQRLTGCRNDAADLTRETFVRALPVMERSEVPADRVETELFATCSQTYFRTSASGSQFIEAADENTDPAGPTLVLKDRKTAPVQPEGLSPRQRESLALREVEAKRYREIGEIVGMPAKAVARLVFLARVAVSPNLKRLADGGWQPTENCPQDLQELSMFADWELHEPAASRTAGHVAGCLVCSDAVAVIRAAADTAPVVAARPEVLRKVRGGVAAALTGTGLVAAPPRTVASGRLLGTRSLAFGSSLAAAACAVAVIGVIAIDDTSPPVAETPAVQPSATPTAPAPSPAPAADPLPSPDPRPAAIAPAPAAGSTPSSQPPRPAPRAGRPAQPAPQGTPQRPPSQPVAQPKPAPRPAPAPVETDPPPAPTPTPPAAPPPAAPPAAPPPPPSVSTPQTGTPTSVSTRTRDDELDLAASPPRAKPPVQLHPEVGMATTPAP